MTHDTDVERATEIIDTVGRELQADPEWGPRLLEAPTVVRISGLGDAAMTLKVLGQVRAAEQWAVTSESCGGASTPSSDGSASSSHPRAPDPGKPTAEVCVAP